MLRAHTLGGHRTKVFYHLFSSLTVVFGRILQCTATMSTFEIKVTLHQLVNKPGTGLMLIQESEARRATQYSDRDRICRDLVTVFGVDRFVDGGVEEYTGEAATGDSSGRTYQLPACPATIGIDDIADSLMKALEVKVRSRSVQVPEP